MRPGFRLWPVALRRPSPGLANSTVPPRTAMPHLLNVWPRVSQLISGASHVLLLSDYDGTLAPIAARPELAALPERTRELLTSLGGSHRITAGVVSGRSLADLKEMVAIPGLVYAGNHGMEMEAPGWQFVHSQAEELEPLLAKLRGSPAGAVGGY